LIGANLAAAKMRTGRDIVVRRDKITSDTITKGRNSQLAALTIASRGQELKSWERCASCADKIAKNEPMRFPECIVMKGFYNNDCANCKFNDQGTTWDCFGRGSKAKSSKVKTEVKDEDGEDINKGANASNASQSQRQTSQSQRQTIRRSTRTPRTRKAVTIDLTIDDDDYDEL
jgi:hypothetical protein